MSKIIYQPKGKAKEYSPWAANFYNGCSNKCDYCYNRHCQAKALLGKDEPTLKKSLNIFNVIDTFKKELAKYREQIIADGKGLFFNFVSDPMLPETRLVNIACIMHAMQAGVPCVVLTKRADWYNMWRDELGKDDMRNFELAKKMVKFGFTLTGCDELEPGASTNIERLSLMKTLHIDGYTVWASIEPIIIIHRSLYVIEQAAPYCDEFKVGLLSGKKDYAPNDIRDVMCNIARLQDCHHFKLTYKDSIYNFIKGEKNEKDNV